MVKHIYIIWSHFQLALEYAVCILFHSANVKEFSFVYTEKYAIFALNY